MLRRLITALRAGRHAAAPPPPRQQVDWLIPWHAIDNPAEDDQAVAELRREIPRAHVLHGLPLRAIARRQDQDDVLFELLDGTGRFANVHLTFARHRETEAHIPTTALFENWDEFARQMREEHAEWGTPESPEYGSPT